MSSIDPNAVAAAAATALAAKTAADTAAVAASAAATELAKLEAAAKGIVTTVETDWNKFVAWLSAHRVVVHLVGFGLIALALFYPLGVVEKIVAGSAGTVLVLAGQIKKVL